MTRKLNPDAEKALDMNANLRSVHSEATMERVRDKGKNKGKVQVRDKYGTVETKPCLGDCDDCKMRFKCWTDRDAVLTEEEWKEADITKGTGHELATWRASILREIPFVDVKPYSHNIISCALRAISMGWGIKEADDTIDEYGLKQLGWFKQGKEKK